MAEYRLTKHEDVPTYRILLGHALKGTWKHRNLFLFGFFAGLLQTGSVINEVVKFSQVLQPEKLQSIFAGWRTAWETDNQGPQILAVFFNAPRPTLIAEIVLGVALLILLIVLAVVAQQVTIVAAHRTTKTMVGETVIFRRSLKTIHFSRLFAANLLSRLALGIVLTLGALLAVYLVGALPDMATVARIAVLLLVFPAALIVNALGILTVIFIVREEHTLPTAFQHATTFLSRHPLATIEFSLILFLIGFVASFVLLFAPLASAGLVLLPAILLGLQGHVLVGVIIFFLCALALVIAAVFLFGLFTLFHYHAWTGLVEQFVRLPALPKLERTYRRLRRPRHKNA